MAYVTVDADATLAVTGTGQLAAGWFTRLGGAMADKVIARAGRTAWADDGVDQQPMSDDVVHRGVTALVLYAIGTGVVAVTVGHILITLLGAITGQRARLPFMLQALVILAVGTLAGVFADPVIDALRRSFAARRRSSSE